MINPNTSIINILLFSCKPPSPIILHAYKNNQKINENIENKTEYLYVGKLGDNRIGCNPVISRIGNHFSYNKIHSQFRNKAFENNCNLNNCNFRVFFKLFEEYNENEAIRTKQMKEKET